MDDPQRFPPPPTADSVDLSLQPITPPAPIDPSITTGKGVKETIESILIAFILAFVFRAFVVEAFVIPTGSMAPTLLGAHMRFTCRECGYEFDVNFPPIGGSGGDDTDIPARAGPIQSGRDPKNLVDRAFTIYCANCRHKVSYAEAVNPPVRYGDRILVLKYLYIPWISSPHRWDVVVFKTPTSMRGAPLYTTNYIKRLIGLPGEEVMILDGDVYIKRGADWEIQTKPKYAQDALWRIIYDHDHRPLEHNRTDGWRLPWVQDAGGAGWDTGDKTRSRVITFDNPSGSGRLRFDPSTVPNMVTSKGIAAPKPRGGYFTDWLAYDTTMLAREIQYGQLGSFEGSGEYNTYTVSDLKLSFSYDRREGDGPLKVHLMKHGHEFDLELTPSGMRLLHALPGRDGREVVPLKAVDLSKRPGPPRVDFAVADYQVTVRIDDELVYETTREEFHPNVADLRRQGRDFQAPTVWIDAARQRATLSHVSLWRDVYYTPENNGRTEILHASPNSPMRLGTGDGAEYFVMGDNSAGSYDARLWGEPVSLPDESLDAQSGCVPARFMLGRAFFVYWPAGYRPLDRAPAVVPDFGDMRLIH